MKCKLNIFFTGWFASSLLHIVLLMPIWETQSQYAGYVSIGCLTFGVFGRIFTEKNSTTN